MTSPKFSIDKVRSDVLAAKVSGRIYVLSSIDVAEVLQQFLVGLIRREDVAEWAEFFDVNEDVELESDEVLPSVLFELSSPEINGWPDQVRVKELIALLESKGT
jgi:hypothetical protein